MFWLRMLVYRKMYRSIVYLRNQLAIYKVGTNDLIKATMRVEKENRRLKEELSKYKQDNVLPFTKGK